MYSLIIVDYNSLKKTIEYIQLCRQSLGIKASAHVVIVENGTPNNPLELMSDHFGESMLLDCAEIKQSVYSFKKDDQQILYCHSGANLGYAGGNNLGVKIAQNTWHDAFYIISNNDLVFQRELDLSFIDRIFEKHPQVGVVGPQIVTPAGEKQSPRRWQSAFHRLFATYWISAFSCFLKEKQRINLCNKYCNDTIQNINSGYCAWVSGCFMFVRADAFHRVGMFDENTFLYAEEMILAKRLESIDSKVYFCREAEVIHKHAESTKKALSALKMVEIDFKSNYYFYKTYTDTSQLTLRFCYVGFRLFKFLYMIKQRISKILQCKCL